MADASSFSSIVPIFISTFVITSFVQSRQRTKLKKELQQLLKDHFPGVDLHTLDVKNVVVRFQGRSYTFPVKALWKEIRKRKYQLLPILEGELTQATGRTAEQLRERAAVSTMTLDTLQFEKTQDTASTPTPLQCTTCTQTLTTDYYEVNGRVACTACKERVSALTAQPLQMTMILRAILYGSGAAAVGCALYYGVRVATGYELGLVAVVVGLLVGNAVRKASGGRGGPVFQGIAMVLTYGAVVFTYLPYLIRANLAHGSSPWQSWSGIVVMMSVIWVFPLLMSKKNLVGLLIIGFALYEAWKLNRRPIVNIAGPFRIGPS